MIQVIVLHAFIPSISRYRLPTIRQTVFSAEYRSKEEGSGERGKQNPFSSKTLHAGGTDNTQSKFKPHRKGRLRKQNLPFIICHVPWCFLFKKKKKQFTPSPAIRLDSQFSNVLKPALWKIPGMKEAARALFPFYRWDRVTGGEETWLSPPPPTRGNQGWNFAEGFRQGPVPPFPGPLRSQLPSPLLPSGYKTLTSVWSNSSLPCKVASCRLF